MANKAWLNPSLLENRLDAVYYGSDFLSNHEQLIRSGIRTAHLRTLVKAGRRAVYFSTDTLDSEEAPESWVPFLTSEDLSDEGCFISLDAQKRVSPAFARRYPNGRLRKNELLVKVKGPNQTTAYNELEPSREILVSGTIWGALVADNIIDPYYLVAALSCHYSATARNRLKTNTNVEFLAADDLLELLVPVPPNPLAQKFIGSQLRRANQLRDFGKLMRNHSHNFFNNYQPETNSFLEQRSYRAPKVVLSDARLDPTFYHPRFLALDNKLISMGAQAMSTFANLPNEAWVTQETVFHYLEIGNVDITTGLINGNSIASVDAPASAQKLVRTWDVLVATVRPNRKNVGIVLPDSDPLLKVASSAFSVLRFHRPEEACFFHAWLRTDAGTQQLVRWNAGSTYPTIDRTVAGIILAPGFNEDERRRQGELWMKGLFCSHYSIHLITAAKLFVDALIEGKVTEAELVAAQEALERGDDAADRTLLRRLTGKGFDVPGQPPLFADLDALYTLLAQTKEAIQ